MLVGTTAKENPDLARVVVDFLDWLDPGEAVSAFTTPVVSVDAFGAWSDNLANTVQPTDTTPLTVASTTQVDANTKLVFLLAAGTPGIVYLVSFVVTGSVSGRQQAIEFRVAVEAAP